MAGLRELALAVVMLAGPTAVVVAVLHFADAPDWMWLATLLVLLGVVLLVPGDAGGEAAGCGPETADGGRDPDGGD